MYHLTYKPPERFSADPIWRHIHQQDPTLGRWLTDQQDLTGMALAWQQSQQSRSDEVPVGAVLMHNGRAIGRGYNQPIARSDPTAHAEIVALRDACAQLGNYRLPEGTTLYVTLEPCTMCVGALIHARVGHVVFGASEPRSGSLHSAQRLLEQSIFNHRFDFTAGVLATQCAHELRAFFKARRH